MTLSDRIITALPTCFDSLTRFFFDTHTKRKTDLSYYTNLVHRGHNSLPSQDYFSFLQSLIEVEDYKHQLTSM